MLIFNTTCTGKIIIFIIAIDLHNGAGSHLDYDIVHTRI